MKDPEKVKKGRRSQKKGNEFENKTREDLESKGWIVSRWCNNINPVGEGFDDCNKGYPCLSGGDGKLYDGELVPAKQGRFRKVSTGYPDFVAYSRMSQPYYKDNDFGYLWAVIFVECKAGKYLKPEEKEKARWYLRNGYCSNFLVAYKEIDKNDLRKRKVSYYEITLD